MSNTKKAKGASPEERRQQIMEAAEYLFAHKGIHAVSLNEINKAAGQKNTSALHYHFGNRKALIDAILVQHHEVLMGILEGPLEDLKAQVCADIPLRQVLATYVAAYVKLLDQERGRHYIQIITQLLYIDVDLALEEKATKQRKQLIELIAPKVPQASVELWNMRTISFVHVLFNTLSLYSQMTEKKAKKVYGSRARFKENLVTVLEGILMVG